MFGKLTRIFSSVAVKLGSVLVFMALLTGVEVYQGLSSAQQSKDAVNAFRTETVPDLERSARIVQAIGLVSEGLSQTLQASDSSDMELAMSDVVRYTSQIGRMASELPDAERDIVLASSKQIESYIGKVQVAQLEGMTFDGRTLKGADELSAAVTAIQTSLSSMIKQTMSEMVERAGNTPETLETLNDIENKRLLSNGLGELQSAILTGASADIIKDLTAAQTESAAMVDAIKRSAAELALPEDTAKYFEKIWEWTDPTTGILAARLVVLNSRGIVEEAAFEASSYVSALSLRAQAHGNEILKGISDTSQATEINTQKNIQTMLIAAGLSLAAILFALSVTFLGVTRPLAKVTLVTERLSKGNMRPVTGFETRKDEIGRMGAALAVFRDGMIERERLRDEEGAREADDLARKTREAAEQQKREQDEREKAAEMERERHAQEAQLLQEKADISHAANEERRALADEQALIVSSLAQAMSRMADGDMAIQINEQFPPAYEALRADFNSAVTSLSEMISQIATSAARIDATSTEIALATNDLSNRTEKSAISLEHTASAINEMTASVASAAENAETADTVARGTNDHAGISQTVVGEAISAMSEIEGSSREISKIIGVIDDISFQTNLLALNAGVEAARAGEAGRGFAVVASEVRALAQRSSDAASEINQLITASNGQVERGVRLVGEAGQTLKDIIDSVSDIATNVNGIAISSREQSLGLQEINSATSQLETTMQQNAAMTEETTAASQVLSVEAQNLIEIVQRFRIVAATETPHAPPRMAGAA